MRYNVWFRSVHPQSFGAWYRGYSESMPLEVAVETVKKAKPFSGGILSPVCEGCEHCTVRFPPDCMETKALGSVIKAVESIWTT